MKKIVLLGDSIRLWGYGTRVPEMLGEGYQVSQPEDNCRFVKYTLRGLFDWHDIIKDADVIHWNNGLWDCTEIFDDGLFTSEEEYVENTSSFASSARPLTSPRSNNLLMSSSSGTRSESITSTFCPHSANITSNCSA